MLRYLIPALLSIFATAASAAPSADLWERWTAHEADASETIDHSAYSALLEKHVKVGDNLNRVDYAALKEDRKALQDYLMALQTIKISDHSRDVQKAYWINLYNAETLRLIADNYPVDSIQDIDISPGFFSSGPWDKKLLKVEGEELSLNDIEHRILRPIWQDPLIHYGVNCASVGCPNLLTEAYTGANVNDKLIANAKAYVNSPRGASFKDGGLVASKIYNWFVADFGGDEQGVIQHLHKYADGELKQKLENRSKIDDYVYDWSLNDVSH